MASTKIITRTEDDAPTQAAAAPLPVLELKERLLRKVKINNGGGATVEWQEVYWNPETKSYIRNNEERTSDGLVSDDLRTAMSVLSEHLAIACEMVQEPKGNHAFDGSLKGLEKFTAVSMVLRGGEQEEGDMDRDPLQVFIFGNKRLKSGRVVNFGTYGIKMGQPNEPYKFSVQLDQHMSAVVREAWLYLQGKVAPPPQQALDLEPAEDAIEESADIGEPQ